MSERKQKARELAERALEWLRRYRGRIVEHGKTLLIVALFCSACFFADQSGSLGLGLPACGSTPRRRGLRR